MLETLSKLLNQAENAATEAEAEAFFGKAQPHVLLNVGFRSPLPPLHVF